MPDLGCTIEEEDIIDATRTPMHGNANEERLCNDDIHHSDEDELNTEA